MAQQVTDTLHIRVTSVQYSMDENTFRSAFAEVAPVRDVHIVQKFSQPGTDIIAVVRFMSPADAARALQQRHQRCVFNNCNFLQINYTRWESFVAPQPQFIEGPYAGMQQAQQQPPLQQQFVQQQPPLQQQMAPSPQAFASNGYPPNHYATQQQGPMGAGMRGMQPQQPMQMGGYPVQQQQQPMQHQMMQQQPMQQQQVALGAMARGRGTMGAGVPRGRGRGGISIPVAGPMPMVGMGGMPMMGMGGMMGMPMMGGMMGMQRGGIVLPAPLPSRNNTTIASIGLFPKDSNLLRLFTLLEVFGGVVYLRRGGRNPETVTVKMASVQDMTNLTMNLRQCPIDGGVISAKPFPEYHERDLVEGGDPSDPATQMFDFTNHPHRKSNQRSRCHVSRMLKMGGFDAAADIGLDDIQQYLTNAGFEPVEVARMNEETFLVRVVFGSVEEAVQCLLQCHGSVCDLPDSWIAFLPDPEARNNRSGAARGNVESVDVEQGAGNAADTTQGESAPAVEAQATEDSSDVVASTE